jgi:Pentapeptide repeats (9 copies)
MVYFRGAKFSGGEVRFDTARFSGGTVRFDDAEFFGSTIRFDDAAFSGGTVDFGGARDWSHPPTFSWDGKSPTGGRATESAVRGKEGRALARLTNAGRARRLGN